MKLVKMSLAAALLVSGAYALDNVKVNGMAKVMYQTSDVSGQNNDLFSKSGAQAQASATLGATADLVENFSAGAEFQVLSTLGLQNNLVEGVMNNTNGVEDSWNASQLWMAASYGKTTAKVGRMELDTPLAFTEKWNIVKNTFEAAVVINQDIENTTLVGAFVGAQNGAAGGQTVNMDQDVNASKSTFADFGTGAYAFGAVNTSIENTTLQAWYYDVNNVADAYWIQADVKNIADMINVGAQYASMDPDNNSFGTANDLDAWAVKVSGTVSDVNLFVAYSSVDDTNANDSTLVVANTATQDKTKLYTGTSSIYMDGAVVGGRDTDTWKIGASTKVAGYSLAASYATAERGNNNVALTNEVDYDAFDFSVGTNVGAIALKAIYTNFEKDTNNNATAKGATSASANYETDTVRIIASVKF
jgi:hypothetical protein